MKRHLALCMAVVLGCGCVSSKHEVKDTQASARAHTELAAEYYSRQQYDVALTELSAALGFEPDYAPAWDVRGLVHMALGQDAKADADFQRSLKVADKPETHNNYGWFLCQHGNISASIDQFMLALRDPLYSRPETAYLNAGICSAKAGNTQKAVEYLQEALRRRSDMPGALLELASLNFQTGNDADADVYFGRFAQVAGDGMSAANLLLGVRIAKRHGNSAAARNYALQLGKRFPDSREYQTMQQER